MPAVRGRAAPTRRILYCEGDSLTAGSGTATYIEAYYPSVLGNLYSPFRPVFNGGVGGQGSTLITARFLARPPLIRSVPAFLWMGRNNPDDPTTIKADFAECVADHPTGDVVVIPPTPSAGDSGGRLSTLATLNSDLATLYGPKFYNVTAFLQSKNDGSANDLADVAAGLIPRSLRVDVAHPNDLGYYWVAVGAKAIADSLGY